MSRAGGDSTVTAQRYNRWPRRSRLKVRGSGAWRGGVGLCLALVAVQPVLHDTLFHGPGSLRRDAELGRPDGTAAAAAPRPAAGPTGGHAARGEVEGRGHHDRAGAADELRPRSASPGGSRPTRPAGRRPAPGLGRRPRGRSPARPEGQGGGRAGRPGQPRRRLRPARPRAQRELATARIEADWKDEIAANVARLIPELRKGTPAARSWPGSTPTGRSGPTAALLAPGLRRPRDRRARGREDDRPEPDRRSSASTRRSSPCTPARGPGQVRGGAGAGPVRRRPAEADRPPAGQERRGGRHRRRPAAPDPGRHRGHRRAPGPPRAGLGGSRPTRT